MGIITFSSMKRIFLAIMLLFITALFSQKSNKSILTYEVSLRKNSKESSTSEAKIKYNQLVNTSKKYIYVLKIKDNESIFLRGNKMEIDRTEAFDLVSVFVGNGLYYYNSITKVILNKKEYLGDNFIIKSKFKSKWQLINKTKKIGKNLCFKAVLYKTYENKLGELKKEKIIAWYNPKLPLNFGIKDYHELPGVIVLLQEEKLNYKLVKTEINPNIQIEIKKPKKGKVVSMNEYQEIIRKIIRKRF